MSAGRERNSWPWEADPSKRRDERGFFSSIFGPPALSKEVAAAEAAATAASRAAAARVLQDGIRGQRGRTETRTRHEVAHTQLEEEGLEARRWAINATAAELAGAEQKALVGAEARAWAAEQKAAQAALAASASKVEVRVEAEDEAEAQLEAEFAAADRAAAEKALQAAMPGWFSSADPVLLGQAVAAGRQHGVSAELLGRAESALAKAEASDIYVEFPAGAAEGAAAQQTTAAAGATPMRRSGGRAASPVSSMYAEQGSVYGRRPAVSTRLGGTGGSGPSGGPSGGPGRGGDFLARLEELEERRAFSTLNRDARPRAPTRTSQ